MAASWLRGKPVSFGLLQNGCGCCSFLRYFNIFFFCFLINNNNTAKLILSAIPFWSAMWHDRHGHTHTFTQIIDSQKSNAFPMAIFKARRCEAKNKNKSKADCHQQRHRHHCHPGLDNLSIDRSIAHHYSNILRGLDVLPAKPYQQQQQSLVAASQPTSQQAIQLTIQPAADAYHFVDLIF